MLRLALPAERKWGRLAFLLRYFFNGLHLLKGP